VFVAGMSTLAVEFTASRLLQTVYGTSNLVWANVIGLVLLSLTAGYFIGGRLADRRPRATVFYGLVAVAGFCAVFFLMLTGAVLREAASALAIMNVGAIAGSLLLVVLALVVPVTLLGCLSPFAIRLAVRDVAEAGRISGRIYAISTLGSLLGTYLPVLVVIPVAGSRLTAVLFGSLLLLIGLVGLWRTGAGRRVKLAALALPILLLPFIAVWLRGGLKSYDGQLYETESAYNYIQVVRQDDCNYLLLNEGQAYHSFYCDGGRVPSISVWSIMLAAPYFNVAPRSPERMAVVGLAAGTIPKQFTQVFGPIPIDGIELDPAIIDAGRRYFALNEPNIRAIAGDGRYVLAGLPGPYDIITIDAYKVPYIPWHMTTREFFVEVSERLSETGVVAVNVGRVPGNRRLVDAVGATLLEVFPTVHAIDVPDTLNTILVATKQPTAADNLRANLAGLPPDADPLLRDALAAAAAHLAEVRTGGPVMTDDRAPTEAISDSIVIRYLLENGPSALGAFGQ
jgi:spermidine synthase